MPERFGLFTIIVLGESIVAVVHGIAEQSWNVASAVATIFGLSIAFSFWWVYFECICSLAIHAARTTGRIGVYQTWLHAHLPLFIGLTATGVGVEHVVSSETGMALPQAERWLVCGAVAVSLLALGIIHQTATVREIQRSSQVQVSYQIGAAIVFVLAAAGEGLLPVVLIGLVAAVCAAQVVCKLYESS